MFTSFFGVPTFCEMKISILAAVFAISLAAAPNLCAREATGAQPANDPGSWVTTSDYPAASLRANSEGVAGFDVSIGTDGMVKACRISRSSGHADLDEATCRVVSERARFTPATDSKGRVVEGNYSSSIRWLIGLTHPPLAGKSTITYTLNTEGKIVDCHENFSGPRFEMTPEKENICANYVINFYPYTDGSGKSVAKRVIVKFETVVEDLP